MAKKYAIIDEPEPVHNSEPPNKPINEQIMEKYNHLYNEANKLLLNRPKMAKKAFIKKLHIYSIVMQKKLMDPNKYNMLKLNIDAMSNKLLKKYKIKDNKIIHVIETIRNATT